MKVRKRYIYLNICMYVGVCICVYVYYRFVYSHTHITIVSEKYLSYFKITFITSHTYCGQR